MRFITTMGEIYIGGCSHSAGTVESLGEDFIHKTWGAKLAAKLGHSLYNDAEPGSSNERIVRKAIERFSDMNNIPDLAIIQFTIEDRCEEPDVREYEFESITPITYTNRGLRAKFSENESSLNKATAKFMKNRRNLYRRNHKTILQRRMIIDILSIQSYLEINDIPYIFMIWNSFLPETQKLSTYKTINHSKIINSIDNFTYDIFDVLFSNGFRLCTDLNPLGIPDNHFMEDAQEFLAEAFYDFIKNGEKISTKNKTYTDEIINHYG